jgi:hypothetical protein
MILLYLHLPALELPIAIPSIFRNIHCLWRLLLHRGPILQYGDVPSASIVSCGALTIYRAQLKRGYSPGMLVLNRKVK